MQSPKPYVEFKDVSVSYRKQSEAVAKINLTIDEGEFVFLVGKTGAGKSTLLKLISREISPQSGTVVIDGKVISEQFSIAIPRLRRKMGIVPQDFALLPKKTVAENIAYASRAAGKTKRQTRRRMAFILFGIHLEHKMHSFPDELSGGEKQRVAIGRALINDPPILLADEPTGNLDPEHSMEVMQLLMNLNERGTTVIVASHDMMVVEQLGKRVIRLDEGRIISDSKFDAPHPAQPEIEDAEEMGSQLAEDLPETITPEEEPEEEESLQLVEDLGTPEISEANPNV
ncbi:MAG: ATP-binding cassette domain-containing protein [Armatimonadota bacterium]